jgi:hypothetical protein
MGWLALGTGAASLLGCDGPPGPARSEPEGIDVVRRAASGGGTIKYADTAVELRAITGGSDGWVAVMLGYNGRGDGGGGIFYWDSAAATDNRGTILNSGGLGSSSAGWRRIFSGFVDVRWFGAVADYDPGTRLGTNNSAAIQAAIDNAPYAVFFSGGKFRVNTSLDLTNRSYTKLYGGGITTQLHGRMSGQPVFTCTGGMRYIFEDLWIEGDATETPSCAVLFARKADMAGDNASSGLHNMSRVTTAGSFTAAALVSISSESNNYVACSFQNKNSAGWCVAITEQNDLGVTTPYKSFPGTFAGGNTVHRFTGGEMERDTAGSSGGCLLIKNVRQLAVHGTFFTAAGGQAAIKVQGGCDAVVLSGVHGETTGATYALMLDAAATLANANLFGMLYGEFYGASGNADRIAAK